MSTLCSVRSGWQAGRRDDGVAPHRANRRHADPGIELREQPTDHHHEHSAGVTTREGERVRGMGSGDVERPIVAVLEQVLAAVLVPIGPEQCQQGECFPLTSVVCPQHEHYVLQ